MRVSLWYPVFRRTHVFRKPIAGTLGVLLLMGAVSSCQSVTALRHEAVTLDGSPHVIEARLKAHLQDGSTILFPDGATIGEDRVTGSGERYDIRLSPVGSISMVPLDSVIAMESFDTETDSDRTVTYNFLPTLIGVLTGVALALGSR